MSLSRNLQSLRRLPASSIRAPVPALQSIASRRFASVNRGKNDAGRDDLGGPGGQDPIPKTSSSPTQDSSSYAAIAGVGVLVCTIFYYMTSSPKEAVHMQEKAQAAQTRAKESVKEAVNNEISAKGKSTSDQHS
ncbi:hypothetical protein F5X68DRAFT_258243 [Plectosphaerella plurivora]|uniref:Uncharacterized protein n=1 Tax=Plectosphaerella plurivora TaxID=936078 RepID=A0A9P9AGJ9_9PEZI|nr:hypothetical protein F5X68DRAFT_258243 [Plectosphaerella plurivora]